MVVSKKEVETVKPPHRVVLDLSQEEAGFIARALKYYAAAAASATTAAGGRGYKQLGEYIGNTPKEYSVLFS